MNATTATFAHDEVVPKALLLLCAAGDRDAARADLKGMFTSDAAVWEALPADVLGESPQGEGGDGSPAFDFAVELTGDPALAALSGASLPNTIDRARSTALVGLEHHVMPGNGDIALFCSLRRKDHLTGDEFCDYWLNKHADYGRKNPANRYRQLHPEHDRQDAVCEAFGLARCDIDGVAEAFFHDIPELHALLNSPDIAGDAFEDECRFIDHARSAFAPFTRIT